MTLIRVEKAFLEELVDFKLKSLLDEAKKILDKWNYQSPEKFLEDAANGELEEAEDDAITLKNLLDQREELLNLKYSWNKEEK